MTDKEAFDGLFNSGKGNLSARASDIVQGREADEQIRILTEALDTLSHELGDIRERISEALARASEIEEFGLPKCDHCGAQYSGDGSMVMTGGHGVLVDLGRACSADCALALAAGGDE